MAAKLVSVFYSQLLESTDPIDPVTQKSLFNYFLRQKKYRELGRLAARPDTIAELDATLRSRNELGVLTGWLARPGRTGDEIVSRLAKEKRVTALVTLAGVENLPHDVYERLAKFESPKISEALLANLSVPREIRVRRASMLFADDHYGQWNAAAASKPSVESDPGFVDALAGVVDSVTGIVFCLENSKVNAENSSRFLKLAIASEKAEKSNSSSSRYYRTGSEEVFCLLASADLTDDDAKTLVKALSRNAKNQSRYGRNDIDRALAVLESRGSEFNQLLTEFEECTDPIRAGERFNALISSGSTYQKERVLSVACHHKALPASFMIPYSDDIKDADTAALVEEWDRRGDVRSLAEAMLRTFYAAHWLDSVQDPLGLLVEIFRLCAETGQEQPYWLMRHPVLLEDPDRVVEVLGWAQLLTLSAEDERLKKAVTEQVTKRLGSDPLLWENFDAIGEEFSGTLVELLETIEKL